MGEISEMMLGISACDLFERDLNHVIKGESLEENPDNPTHFPANLNIGSCYVLNRKEKATSKGIVKKNERLYKQDETKKEQDSYDTYFIRISSEYGGDIVYDSRTGVQYWKSEGTYNRGSLTMLVDADGKPLIYKEEK